LDKLKPPEKKALVIGGGVAGLEASRNLAYAGYGVFLVEKEPVLGGMVRRLNQLYPEGMPNGHTLQPLIEEVWKLDEIKVLTETEVIAVEGDIGDYEVTLRRKDIIMKVKVGVIIVATGLKEYDVSKVTAYGYGRYKNVLKPIEFEEKISSGEIDPKELENVVIILCAGSRDVKYLPYCSRVCCFIGLKEAKLIKDHNPDTEVYICYIDMRSGGSMDRLHNTLRYIHGVHFIRGRPSKIEEIDGKPCVKVEDMASGILLNLCADYVILSHGYVSDEKILSMLNVPLDTGDKGKFPTTYFYASLSIDSNPRGIFVCGGAAYPRYNVAETLLEARGVVLSAINTLRDITLRTPIPEIDPEICAQAHCKLCLYACPYNAIIEEDGKIKVLPSLCMGCGICTATCPTGANRLEGLNDDELFKEIEEKVEEDDTVAFFCKWSAYPAYEKLNKVPSEKIKVIKLPGTGRVSADLILKTFQKKARNVLISGCYPDGCHYNRGNLIMKRRLYLTRTILDQLGISHDRVRIEWIGKKEMKRLSTVLEEMRRA